MITRLLKVLAYITFMPLVLITGVVSLILAIPSYIIFDFNLLEYTSNNTEKYAAFLKRL